MNKALLAILIFVELALLITSPLAALAGLMLLALGAAFFSTFATVIHALFDSNPEKKSP